MQHNNYLARIAVAGEVRLLIIFVLIISFGINLVLGFVLSTMPKGERVYLSPPAIEKSFWMQGDKLSQEYLEQMGYFVIQLMLNATPNSVQYQGKQLLAVVSPLKHAEIKKMIDVNAALLTRNDVSTYFASTSVSTDLKTAPMRIAFTGDLLTIMSDKSVQRLQKVFMVEFGWNAGRMELADFRETNSADPLGLKQAPKEAQ